VRQWSGVRAAVELSHCSSGVKWSGVEAAVEWSGVELRRLWSGVEWCGVSAAVEWSKCGSGFESVRQWSGISVLCGCCCGFMYLCDIFAIAGANGAIVELGQLQRCRM
jgi:hypothetical protein